ncbi:MAG: SMP-30/gluconolactonase/LRE family protein [Thermoguttaceae bacterium]
MSATTRAKDAGLPRPTPEQAAWQDLELGMFYHFDISTFADGGEGDWPRQGHLDPSLYNPAKLNTDQWLEAAKAMGAGYTVFVAKHCTGFISWQSDAYPYGVRQSKWRDGKGDVVADYVASCRKCGIQPGIYCSMPANAYCDVFGNCTVQGASGSADPRQVEYRRRAERLATELWGNYGPLTYIWFDGGTLSPEKGGPDLVPILKRLQPHAVTFQGPPDNPAGNTRWPGNEQGVTGYPSWSTVVRANDSGAGNPQGKVWQPGECDAPLRNHDWFWHPNHESKIRTVAELVEMYYGSVGRGCNLILNGNIDRDGLVPQADLKRFQEFGDEIRRRFGTSIAETSGRGNAVELALAKPTVIDNVILMEQITAGERVRRYVLEGLVGDRWQELAHGQSIGHKRIERFAPLEVTKIRFRATETVAEPLIRKLAVYHAESVARPKPATAKPSGSGVRQVLVADPKLPRVLLIGDSILNGYHAKAAELLRGKVNLDVWVTPKHIGSKDLPDDMKAIFAEHTYDLILFNDVGLHAWEPGRIPEGQYEPLMRAHLANLRKFAPKAKLVFASTTPMTTKSRPIALDPEFNPLIVQRNRIAAKIMAASHIPVADYYGTLVTKLDLAAGDRFHWTKPAYDLLAQCAAAHIEQALPAAGEKEATYPTLGRIERLDPRFDKLVPRDAVLEKLAEGFKWSEGPVWIGRPGDGSHARGVAGGPVPGPPMAVPPSGYLLFSDIPNNAVMKWKDGEGISVFLKPSGYTGTTPRGGELGSNALTLDVAGRLVLCQHGDRRIVRREADGRWTTLVDRYDGKRLSSPNDLVFKSNGDLYFTDPPYGLPQGANDPTRELDFCGVFRVSAADGKVTLLTKEMTGPNGIAFSPDEKILYVSQSDPHKAVWMAFAVKEDGTVGPGRVFYDATRWTKTLNGLPDGMKIDRGGNLFAAGPGGINVFSPDGTLLGRINPDQPTSNCAFGEDGSVLYITANQYLCRIKTSTKGKGF